jgi:hypothetical protein
LPTSDTDSQALENTENVPRDIEVMVGNEAEISLWRFWEQEQFLIHLAETFPLNLHISRTSEPQATPLAAPEIGIPQATWGKFKI